MGLLRNKFSATICNFGCKFAKIRWRILRIQPPYFIKFSLKIPAFRYEIYYVTDPSLSPAYLFMRRLMVYALSWPYGTFNK